MNELQTTENIFSYNKEKTELIYYISDIHLENQIKNIENNTEEEISVLIEEKLSKIAIEKSGWGGTLIVAGDTSHSKKLTKIFYRTLLKVWKGTVIAILGNHELWEIDRPNQSIDELVEEYREALEENNNLLLRVYLLENSLCIRFMNKSKGVLKEEEILNLEEEKLREILENSTQIILGGVGFSGLNKVYNANCGMYKNAVENLEEDKGRSERFYRVYSKIKKCAGEKHVIVATHTPVENWIKESCNPNWTYIHGHTHRSDLSQINGALVLSDNQIGYKPKEWHLKATKNDWWYNPFESREDGIYEITREEYAEFNKGRGIQCEGCGYAGDIIMLKKNETYMFLLKTSKSVCLLKGGHREKLKNTIEYYYGKMDKYEENVRIIFGKYWLALKSISEEIMKIGGSGKIHGCIVDISFFSHIYLNPYDGSITPYTAQNMSKREIQYDMGAFLRRNNPELVERYLENKSKGLLPNIENLEEQNESRSGLMEDVKKDDGTYIYNPSKYMIGIQYLIDKNVIRQWDDKILDYVTR